MVNASKELDIERILEYSVFDNSVQQTIIASYGFETYYNILTIGESDIINLAKGLSDRNVAERNTSFGLRHTNLLKATTHWNQDFRRISQTPSLIGISNAAKFCTVIDAERSWLRIGKHTLEELARLSKATNPGKLKCHKEWITWSRALKNYM